MTKRHTHVHKYQLIEWGIKKTLIFKCMVPGCTHYVPKALAENRKSVCWNCEEEFTLTKDKLNRVKPKCNSCVRRKGSTQTIFEDIDELLEGLDK